MKATLYTLLFWLLLSGCSKKTNSPDDQSPDDPSPEQYGTPFTGVPDPEDAVLYQVNIRAFSSQGNLKGVTARLDEIKSLGANVVYLMPIHPVGQLNAFNSPYCIKDYNAVSAEFGTLNDLRELVDAAHSKGLAVILDWVANHTSWDHTWINEHKNWYQQNSAGQIVSPPEWRDVAQLNFTNNDLRKEMIRSMKSWIYKANVDGFRCDYADGPPLDFWKQAIDSLRSINTHKLLLMAEGSRNNNFLTGFDYNFGFNFYGTLKSVIMDNAPVSTLFTTHQAEYINAAAGKRIVRYITNHDVNGSDGSPVSLFNGNDGAMAAFITAVTLNSVPMIYNGQEIGMQENIPFPFTSVKINWSNENTTVKTAYKTFIEFRNNNVPLKKGSLQPYNNNDVVVFTRTHESETVLVIVNMRNNNQSYEVPAAIRGNWKNGLNNNESFVLNEQLSLSPYQYLILQKTSS